MFLRYIYVFFVAVFLAMFIGIGIAVFYPQPEAPVSPQFYGKELTSAEQAQMNTFNTKQAAFEKAIAVYNRNVSLIAIVCAVVLLVVSLMATNWIGILANGLLLGGIFTLIYGIGRGMATDSNQYRFLVAGVGLAITLVLGYLKFSRKQAKQAEPSGAV